MVYVGNAFFYHSILLPDTYGHTISENDFSRKDIPAESAKFRICQFIAYLSSKLIWHK